MVREARRGALYVFHADAAARCAIDFSQSFHAFFIRFLRRLFLRFAVAADADYYSGAGGARHGRCLR